jgi:hypothetical protein
MNAMNGAPFETKVLGVRQDQVVPINMQFLYNTNTNSQEVLMQK